MCFKYEKSYGNCFDLPFVATHVTTINEVFEDLFGAELTDMDRVKEDLFLLFEKWHEDKIMKPVEGS